MDVKFTTNPGPPEVTIIRTAGVFDASATEAVMEPYQNSIKGKTDRILFDLCDVSFMSSIGIRIINVLYYDLHPRGSETQQQERADQIRSGEYKAPYLKILCPRENVKRVLTMAGINEYIEIFDDETAALQSFLNEE